MRSDRALRRLRHRYGSHTASAARPGQHVRYARLTSEESGHTVALITAQLLRAAAGGKRLVGAPQQRRFPYAAHSTTSERAEATRLISQGASLKTYHLWRNAADGDVLPYEDNRLPGQGSGVVSGKGHVMPDRPPNAPRRVIARFSLGGNHVALVRGRLQPLDAGREGCNVSSGQALAEPRTTTCIGEHDTSLPT